MDERLDCVIPRESRFVIARDFRRLCTERGYSAAEVQRLLGEDTPYQTVASWGLNRDRHRTRQNTNLPSTRWLRRILEVFPELRDGASSFAKGPSVAKVEIFNRQLPIDAKRRLESLLISSAQSAVVAMDGRHLSASPCWRHPAEHTGDIRRSVGCAGAPVGEVRHFIEMLGLGVVMLEAGSTAAPWCSVAQVTMHGTAPANFVAIGGYQAGSANERYALLLCLGLFLVGSSARGNAKHAAAAQFADEVLVDREVLMRWVRGGRFITEAHVQFLAHTFGVSPEVVARQCKRTGVRVRGSCSTVPNSFHAFRASLVRKASAEVLAASQDSPSQPTL
jgi:hypothetical protein